MNPHHAFEEAGLRVRRYTLTEALGADEAERQLQRSPLLAPHLDDEPTQPKPDLLRHRRPDPGGSAPPPDNEQQAHDAGLSVERWRGLAR